MNKAAFAQISPVWSRSAEILVECGQGAYLYATDGRQYLDFTSGIGVTNTGHVHPKVVEAIQQQAACLLHGQANLVYHKPMLRLTEKLSEIMPSDTLDTFFFSNSGAEAVEGAVKLARAATGKPNIIVFQGSFHGRTHATMAMTTSKTVYRAGYQPLIPGIFVAPYPYTYRYGWDDETTVAFCLKELKHLLKTQTAPEETAAIVIEPVLGEGGYVVPPPSFLPALRELCDHYHILLVADEVQSGFGRTGQWFAVNHTGVTPDILIMAKGMASGMPLSGLAASSDLMRKWPPGSHGGTYGGNAVACAAAIATIEVMQNERLIENSAQMGELLRNGLHLLQKVNPEIGDVRGLGLMVATEFTTPDGEPWGQLVGAVVQEARKRGLLLLTCGAYGHIVRWIPPLIVTPPQIQDALRCFAEALAVAK